MWIGLLKTGGVWRWTGRMTTIVQADDAVWQRGEPSGTTYTQPYGCVKFNWSGINDCSRTWSKGHVICEQKK